MLHPQLDWDRALTGALQLPSIDNRWKGHYEVLNSRVYSNMFGRNRALIIDEKGTNM